ncbi:bifunctional diguanylate cyclase/phosphodiesterase [Marinobacter xestospongiae]|uniref:bifunctional diguanylate cyclase/phosphodiesterase n=1 Tax=Marinobacter xestospongiae TaxID=994319 RepID=UPI0020064AC6|nr:diguanylate cyclase [Marinobacter xestospongiae]MCK7565701.1 diguanylate cyclase [Marinobacter xestospongiae]
MDQNNSIEALPSSVDQLLPYIFSHMDDAVIIANSDREMVTTNDAARLLFGYNEQEMEGNKTLMLYANSDDYADQGRKRFNQAAQAAGEAYVTSYKRKDGTVFDGETLGGAVRDKSGQVLFFIGIVKDVSTRVATEQTLNELHSITSSRALDFEQRVDAMLKLGSRHFGLPIGIFSKIEGNTYTVMQAIHPENALTPGMTFELEGTYCSHVYAANNTQGFHHVAHSSIQKHPCYLNFGLEAYLGAPIFVDEKRYGTLNFSSPSPTRPFIQQDYELVKLFAEWIGHELARLYDLKALEQARQELETLSQTDPLTGLYNRRHMEGVMNEEVERAARYAKPLSVALFDFDHFKRLNDTYGHAAGDDALKLFARTVKDASRCVDLYCRWGGEEFIAAFPETSALDAKKLLERIISKLKAANFSANNEHIALTMSIGLTEIRQGDSIDTLIQRADEAMYEAKHGGRDRIVTHP